MKRILSFSVLIVFLSICERSFAGNLYINEVLLNPPPSPENPFEYIELRGEPGEVLPNKTYFLAVDSGTPNSGKIRNFFDLGGMQVGTNGFLELLQKNHRYAT